MAKFDPKKADLNKDGKLSSYEKNRGAKTAAAMQMGYTMKMGKSSSSNTAGAFRVKDEAMLMATPMRQTELAPGMQGYYKQERAKGRDAVSIRADYEPVQVQVPQNNFQTNYEIQDTLFPGSVSDSNLLGSMDTSAYTVSRGSTVGPLDRQPVKREDGTVTYTYGGQRNGGTKEILKPKGRKKEKTISISTSGVDTSTASTLPQPKSTKTETLKKETATIGASSEKIKTKPLTAYERRQNIRGVKVAEREVRRQLRKTKKGKAVAGGYEAALGNLQQAQSQLKQAQTTRLGGTFTLMKNPLAFKGKKSGYKK